MLSKHEQTRPDSGPAFQIDGVDIVAEGDGAHAVLLVHGWPDSYRLWDPLVAHLLAAFPGALRCVRFTLPGFDLPAPPRPRSFGELAALVAAVADRVSPDRPVTLVLHDWGCVFGYEFAARHPGRVARIVAVDIGDHNAPELVRSLGLRAKLMVAAYQLWLVLAWRLGRLGAAAPADWMTRFMARLAGSRRPPQQLGWPMNYPYDVQWTGSHGGPRVAPVAPACPVLYIYGRRKPFQFQSPQWLARLAGRPGCRVQPFATGHWPMLEQPDAFNRCVSDWLGATPV